MRMYRQASGSSEDVQMQGVLHSLFMVTAIKISQMNNITIISIYAVFVKMWIYTSTPPYAFMA
jgi:hypothetical protein